MNHHFRIEGMTCGACSARVQDGLSKFSNIEKVNINLAMNTGYVEGTISQQEIEKAVWDLGYTAKFGQAEDDLEKIELQEKEKVEKEKYNFIFAAIATFPVFLLGMGFINLPYGNWLQLILTTYVMFFPGRKFFSVAYKLAKSFSANMDTLVAMGTGSAWLYSCMIIGNDHAHGLYFESAAVIITLVLLGKFLEERAKKNATAAIRELSKLQPQTAILWDELHGEKEVSIKELKKNDVVIIKVGAKVPTDGQVYSGQSEFDEAMITGESIPVVKTINDNLVGGTINVGSTTIKMCVKKLGSETVLAQIIKMVHESQASKPDIQNLADKISLYFVPIALSIAVTTFLAWLMMFDKSFIEAFVPAITVLVIACPCALGLATPAAIVTATGRAAQKHILIRSSSALEYGRNIQTIILDKTGTITKGQPEVIEVVYGDLESKIEFLAIAEFLERNSQHPLAKSICRYVKNQDIDLINSKEMAVKEISGFGLEAIHNDTSYVIGKKEFLIGKGIKIPELWQRYESSTCGLVYLSVNNAAVVLFVLQDVVRDSAKIAVKRLRDKNIELIIATGDRKIIAEDIAKKVGISIVKAELTPEAKKSLVQEMKKSVKKVAMIGDGINDAPSLAEADLGIALGDGTDVAMNAAQLVLPNGDLSRVADAIDLSIMTMRIVKQNLFWAFFYNSVAIPLAAMGKLSPMIAAAAMACSSLTVVFNSLRLRKFDIYGVTVDTGKFRHY